MTLGKLIAALCKTLPTTCLLQIRDETIGASPPDAIA